MRMECKQATLDQESADALIIGVLEDAAPRFPRSLLLEKICEDFLALDDFKPKLNETALIYPNQHVGPRRVLFVGLGERDEFNRDKVRQSVGTAARELMKLGVSRFAVAVETFTIGDTKPQDIAQCVAEGAMLATYQFNEYKEIPKDERVSVDQVTFLCESGELVSEIDEGVKIGATVASATTFARDLQNHPGNRMTPTRLAEVSEKMATSVGLRYEVLDRTAMKKLKMGSLLGVAKGSLEPPRFIILEHNGNNLDLDTVVLVGKGITFDSGGISIKPSASMEEMKFDMSGAAAVIGAMQAVAQLEIPLHVVGLVPAAENLPSGSAVKPGDILTASSGTTIEIINTDAEGRLILADALLYAHRFKPNAVVDLATLTGACVVALGYYATGLFSTDETLVERLLEAGKNTGERLWRLPLWDEYQEDMKSDHADLKNSGGRWGGASTAAAFLANFVEGYPWAHLDIAGTAYTEKEKGYTLKGGTGVGVRLLVQFLRDWVTGEKN